MKISKGYILIFFAGIFWGTIGTSLKLLSNQGLNPMQVTFFMQLFALLFMLPLVLVKCGIKALKIPFKLFLILAITGLFSETLFDIVYTNAVNELGVAVSSVLMYLAPLFVILASRVLFNEAITRNKIIAFIVNLIGCFLTVTGGSFDGSKFSFVGVLFGIGAAICYGVITVSDKYTADEADPLVINFYILLSGFLSIALISRSWTFPAEVFNAGNFLIGAGAGLFSGLLPYLFFAKGLACDIEASRAPIFASIEVVIAAILGVILFKEYLGVVHVLGIAVVIVSIVIMNAPEKSK